MPEPVITYECIAPEEDLWRYKLAHWNGKEGFQRGHLLLTVETTRPESQPKNMPTTWRFDFEPGPEYCEPRAIITSFAADLLNAMIEHKENISGRLIDTTVWADDDNRWGGLLGNQMKLSDLPKFLTSAE